MSAPWVDAGMCVRCRHTLWRVNGGLVAKATLSAFCRRGQRHQVKA